MPKLKDHLQLEWERQGAKAKRKGTKRKASPAAEKESKRPESSRGKEADIRLD
jgi:hypothetical protein